MNNETQFSVDDTIVVVDLQNDFCLGGALAVSGTDDGYIGCINAIIGRAESEGARVIFTQDWHPLNHCSFHEQGGPWPTHCVAGTNGAELNARLHVPDTAIRIKKGTKANQEEYSGYDTEKMKRLPILAGNIYVVGVALEYCVKATAISAQAYLSKNGSVYVIKGGVRSIEQDNEKIKKHYKELENESRIQII